MIKRMIPNALTMGNLFCGCMAVVMAVQDHLDVAALFVVVGIVFDFFDGFAARMLKVTGPLGKQLDSLADMVTSGLVPGIVMYQLLHDSIIMNFPEHQSSATSLLTKITFFGFIITLASAYRLAKFNIDTRQSNSFIGLPTPANTLFIVSLPLILQFQGTPLLTSIILNQWFLIVLTLLSAFLLNANIPLFALKFRCFGFKENALRYCFLMTAIVLMLALKFIAIPVIVVLYILLSLVNNVKSSL
jgi:CDP-diacylglycerol--serine O-phosphatidyltransferase